ncbi:MAG: hypothetical protein GDA36_01555 [Rhodobacteraceae bacterium]|nr:hypothetical protein [Paracoccaceae bacterium]
MELTKVEMPNGSNTPVRKSARRLRWFKETLHRQADALHTQLGIQYAINDDELRVLFLRWLEAFEAQKPTETDDKADFVDFASGLMLRELIKSKPVTVESLPANADKSNPAYFWPEGYLYVILCLNIRAAVLAQEFDIEKHDYPELDDLGAWWSFKENVEVEDVNDDVNLAIGFFDLFAGVEPNWSVPGSFFARTLLRKRKEPAISMQRSSAIEHPKTILDPPTPPVKAL